MENPADGRRRGKIMAWTMGFVLLAIVAAAVLVALGVRTPQVSVERDGLRISNSLFGRTIPAADFDSANARIIDFKTSPQLAPQWRTFGVGIFGHQSGWYRLRNGSNALLFLTRSDGIIYIETRKGYSVLISPDTTQLTLSSIKNLH